MSYVHSNRQDSLNEYFSDLVDFILAFRHLLQARTEFEFEIWLEKCEAIDRRSLYFYLRAYKHDFPATHLRIAQRRYIESL